jgi:arginyl-tRNA--protein-N-Asp/Glu arginylyltransferase
LALQLAHFVSDEHDCDYLPGARAAEEYRVVAGLQADELDQLLAHGWRRFGAVLFRPACRACHECVSLRIAVADFHPSRSQRRARNRCAHLTVEIGPPHVDDQRVGLYQRWHAEREQSRDWEAAPLDLEEYARQFGPADACAREVSYRDGERLVGVGLCDETATAWNAIYFFSDPAYQRLSLGVNHVLTLIERARRDGKAHVYLGFRVIGCASMRYKAGFLPHQLLEGRPDFGESPRWLPVVGSPEREG